MTKKKSYHSNQKFSLPNKTLFLRKINLYYNYFLLSIKLILLCLIFVICFTSYLNPIKQQCQNSITETTANLGFRLTTLIISGQINLPTKEILNALNATKGTSILSIDLRQVQQKLQKSDWVKDSCIQRSLPNTIKINIIERQPIAIWQYNNNFYLVDKEGYKIKTENINKFNHLIHIIGLGANTHAKQLIKDLNTDHILAKKVIAAIYYGERRWDLIFQENILVKMPEDNFISAWSDIIQLNKNGKLFSQHIKMIDLRNPNKYYIEKHKVSAS